MVPTGLTLILLECIVGDLRFTNWSGIQTWSLMVVMVEGGAFPCLFPCATYETPLVLLNLKNIYLYIILVQDKFAIF